MPEWIAIILIPTLFSTFRAAVPLVFAAMGGLLSERSGIVNIALEGLMLVGAFFAAITAYSTHSAWLGFFVGGAAGICLAAVYAFFVLELKSDQIVAGTGINILAMGIPPFVSKIIFDNSGSTPGLPLSDRFEWAPLVLVFIAVLLVHYIFYSTKLGLWLRFAGEKPEALQAAGVSVKAVRWMMVMGSGFFAGLGGSTLSLLLASSYSRNMTSGRGFMALAALIFGKWKPIPATLACLFFALSDSIQIKLQGVSINGHVIPVQFIQILPYIVTIVVLAGLVGSSKPPAALGTK